MREAVQAGRPELVVGIEGWDIDPDAVAACTRRMHALCAELGLPQAPRVRHRDGLALDLVGTFDAVVGNPPYLEAKRMPSALKARLRRDFPIAARGAFDLYGVFTEQALRLLAPAGELAFVVPNRLLVTAATGALRSALLASGELGIVDLSRERVFADAAVYPVVVRLDRSREAAYLVEDLSGSVAMRLSKGAVARLDGRLPVPDAPLRPLLERVLGAADAWGTFRDAVEVRWTCSFHRAGLRDRYVGAERPESPHARPFLGGLRFAGNRELAPFRIAWAGAWIDYDEARARADGNPLPPLALFEGPKVVVPQNLRRMRAALDETGLVLKDTFLAIRPREAARAEVWLPWVVLVLNSAFFQHLYEGVYGGTRKGGGYLQVLGSYLHPLPLPEPPAGVREAYSACKQDPTDLQALAHAEDLVRAAYGVTPAESALLDATPCPLP